jgi:hypothetical protein
MSEIQSQKIMRKNWSSHDLNEGRNVDIFLILEKL